MLPIFYCNTKPKINRSNLKNRPRSKVIFIIRKYYIITERVI